MFNNSLFTSNSDEWETPISLFNELDSFFHFTLDPCSTDDNCLCSKHFTISNSGLTNSWKGEVVFCNPPYSNIKDWARKCRDEFLLNDTTVVLLIPSRTDTAYFHDFILPHACIKFIRGRLHFSNSKHCAPFPSMICVFDKRSVEVSYD